jgi:hypothetical protein
MQKYDIDESRGYPIPIIVPDDLGEHYLVDDVDAKMAEKQSEIDHLKQELDDAAVTIKGLHTEANKNMEELCEWMSIFAPLDDPEAAYIVHSSKYVIQRIGDFEKAEQRIKELESEATPLIDKAADFIGCSDDLKSIACIDVALDRAKRLEQRIKELEVAEEKQRDKKEYYHEEHAKEIVARLIREGRTTIIEEKPPQGSVTDPEIARKAFRATYGDRFEDYKEAT